MMRPLGPLPRENGSATLSALIVMVLATMILSGLIWQQHLSIRQLEYNRDRSQAEWLHTAAVDSARFVLALNAKTTSREDSLTEAWAIPLTDTKVSDFLRGVEIPEELSQLSMMGQITDAQGRFNLNNLVDQESGRRIHPESLAIFQTLLGNLGADRGLAHQVANLLVNSGYKFSDMNQLGEFNGFTPQLIQRLRPLVTALPVSTKINVNTASSDVLRAVFLGMNASQAANFITARTQKPIKSLEELKTLLTNLGVNTINDSQLVDIKTDYFIARTEVRYPESIYVGESIIERSAPGTIRNSRTLTRIFDTRFFSTLRE
jgi:general secretion pathway protein K